MWSCSHILLFTFPLETEANLVKFNEELVGLEKELKKEQEKVEEIKAQIEESKEILAAQNQEISRRVMEKEQKEQKVW